MEHVEWKLENTLLAKLDGGRLDPIKEGEVSSNSNNSEVNNSNNNDENRQWRGETMESKIKNSFEKFFLENYFFTCGRAYGGEEKIFSILDNNRSI